MRQIRILRIGLLAGVIVFAVTTMALRHLGNLPEAEAEVLRRVQLMRYAVWGLSAFALGWAFYWRARAESARSEEGMRSAFIIGMAPGEGAAILGIVSHFIGGPGATMVFGIMAFLIVLLILRLPGDVR